MKVGGCTFSTMKMVGGRLPQLFNDPSLKLIGTSGRLVKVGDWTMYTVRGSLPQLVNAPSLKLIGTFGRLVKVGDWTFSTMYTVGGRLPQLVNDCSLKLRGSPDKLVYVWENWLTGTRAYGAATECPKAAVQTCSPTGMVPGRTYISNMT